MTAGEPQMPVWTLAQRVAHALLAVAVLTCLATHEGGAWHLGLGMWRSSSRSGAPCAA